MGANLIYRGVCVFHNTGKDPEKQHCEISLPQFMEVGSGPPKVSPGVHRLGESITKKKATLQVVSCQSI